MTALGLGLAPEKAEEMIWITALFALALDPDHKAQLEHDVLSRLKEDLQIVAKVSEIEQLDASLGEENDNKTTLDFVVKLATET